MTQRENQTRPPIAIVGLSALFPGSSSSGGFWRDILAGTDLLTDIPETHWLPEDYYDEDPAAPDKTYAKRGGFLPEIDFDALQIHAPEMVWDLPAQGRRLVQQIDGYRYTIKSGQVTYEDGVATGSLPGKLVRGPQALPSA